MKILDSVDLFELLGEYYHRRWIENGNAKFLKKDSNIVVLEEKESKTKIAIKRENLIPEDLRVTEVFGWYKLEEFFRNYNYELDNKIKFSKDKGFYAKEYAEYLFKYIKIESEFPETAMRNFRIDDVEFEIGEPSQIFKLIFHHIAMDDNFDWDGFYTIKLRNVKKDEVEPYLQNAMYYLHKYSPSDLIDDYPHIYQYTYYPDNFINMGEETDSKLNKNFRLGKYPEAIAFYNEGKLKQDFLSFYKVLEYFFLINRKEEFASFILDYNHNKDIDRMIKEITGVYKTNEDVLLKNLLSNVNNIDSVMNVAFLKGLITNKDDREEFANALYSFRNSKVHGKKDTNLSLLVPSISDSENKDWEIIIENIADLIINQFCYSK
ncbi:hypothetical protein CN918_32080 [Priestia megaterium]|nr:hypothetical protein CN918_32080 [Priestia megaterium]